MSQQAYVEEVSIVIAMALCSLRGSYLWGGGASQRLFSCYSYCKYLRKPSLKKLAIDQVSGR